MDEVFVDRSLIKPLRLFIKNLGLDGFTEVKTLFKSEVIYFDNTNDFANYCKENYNYAESFSEYSYQVRFGDHIITLTYMIVYDEEPFELLTDHVLINYCGDCQFYCINFPNECINPLITDLYNDCKTKHTQSLIKSAVKTI